MKTLLVYYVDGIRVTNYAPGQHIFASLAAHNFLAAIEAEEKAQTAQSSPIAAQEVAPTSGEPIGAGRQ